MTFARRVRRLVQSGKVGPEEGESLLAALAERPARSPFWILVNPFDRFGGGPAAGAGLFISVCSLLVARLGVRFDGFLDLHVARWHVPSLGTSLLEQAVAWPLGALLFWSYAQAVTRHVRFLDFIGMCGLARLPLLVAAIPIALLSPHTARVPAKLTPGLLAVSLVALPCVVWHLTLLYQGFKNASGIRGVKLTGAFVFLVILAELLSKAALAFMK